MQTFFSKSRIGDEMTRVRPIAASRIKAAVKAAEDAGVRVGAIEVQPDGTIRVEIAGGDNAPPKGGIARRKEIVL
jgi:hypothetical protein